MRSPEQIRKEKNESIVERVKLGLSVAAYSPAATWFQPRPIIKKDKNALDFGLNEKRVLQETPSTERD